MIKRLSLMLALLLLFSLPVFSAWGAEGDSSYSESGEDYSEDTNSDRSARRIPAEEKSLAYWEQTRGEIALTGDLRQDVLIIAQSQVGYTSDEDYYNKTESGRKRFYTRYGEWYGRKFSEWCDMFVSFCVYYAGGTDYPVEYSCMRHMFALKKAGYWREWNCYIPQPGELVFFCTRKSSRLMPNHVAVVEEVIPAHGIEPSALVVSDGNMSNPNGGTSCVRRSTYTLDEVVGYGVYEVGKTYSEWYSVRAFGWEVFGPDSTYFVETPTREALQFLGMQDTKYYEYWFPEEELEESEETEGSQEETAAEPETASKQDPS